MQESHKMILITWPKSNEIQLNIKLNSDQALTLVIPVIDTI